MGSLVNRGGGGSFSGELNGLYHPLRRAAGVAKKCLKSLSTPVVRSVSAPDENNLFTTSQSNIFLQVKLITKA